MKGPRWCIVLFSSRSRKFELWLSRLHFVVYGLAPLLGIAVPAALLSFLQVRTQDPASLLDTESALVSRSLEQTERRLDRLQGEVQKMVALDEKVRVVSDLEIINEEVRGLGVGGTDWHLKEPETVAPRYGKRLAEIGERIEALKRQIGFEQESFEEIVSSLSERQVRLAHTPSIMPARGFVTSYYGWRSHPLTGHSEFHRGLDIANLVGAPVVVSADGRVSFAGWKRGFGRLVEVDHGYGYITRYGHLRSIHVRVGDSVFRGQAVGLVGSSGDATGPHVHYEVLVDGNPTNPRAYICYAGLF